MKILIFIVLFLFVFQYSFSQEIENEPVDSLYKEDQFYAGLTYNFLANKPINLSQSGFSLGFHFGFIKDMPINKNRNVAIGIGLGYSANSFNQNLQIYKTDSDSYIYAILEDKTTYSRNKFSNHFIELPVEFRWRTSNATDYEFWRVYAGFKLSYMVANNTKYVGNTESLTYKGIPDFNQLQYGVSLCAGYNTWNFYVYYALNPIFSSKAKAEGQSIDMNALKIGLMFYVL